RAADPLTGVHSVSFSSLPVTMAPGPGVTPRPGSHPAQSQSSADATAMNGTTGGRHLELRPRANEEFPPPRAKWQVDRALWLAERSLILAFVVSFVSSRPLRVQ